jgi:2-dehydro-3-deoxy-D-gluconate 5-dehydrogenase
VFSVAGRAALVTGGSSGIGLGMARGLLRAGASVMIAARGAERNAAAVVELSALGVAESVVADVTDEASVQAMVAACVARFGRLDILVANAGTTVRKLPQSLTLADWRLVLDTNLTSTLLAAQAAHPHLKASGHGRVITNGSMMSLFASSYSGAYAASKGGVVQLTRALAVAWAPDAITANCILPGWVDTPLTQGARREVAGLHERVLARTPAARWGTPTDFEGVAAFLASDAAAFITGTAIPVDGGYSVQA